ncbi:MAG TPA: alpha-isopropylmalate synthase regulatory domain-containing protein, partial [Candidatus Dormibacteraeota bacterium]|nr:alpha-isopropylmalate synthase regulatory domain-containing protein [Candidatus Dormibacteraeota bacterium]
VGARATAAAAAPGSRPLGIHCHNDIGLAVAATLAAVEAGAQMVQGTINGCGERCGNADLLVVAATLQLKMGRPVLPEERLCELVPVSRLLDTLLDRSPDPHRPYVGGAAFLHKAGLHAQGIAREAMAYQHLEPERVGNRTRTVVSDLSGRASIAGKLRELGLGDLDAATHGRLVERLKGLEVQGWAFEDADASFELLVRRTLAGDVAPFALQDFTVLAHRDQPTVQATVKVQVGDAEVHTAADGNGPVAALDAALRKALGAHFPVFSRVQLADYRVRVIDGDRGTGATVRVGIDSTDGQDHWTTVGCSSNILEASALALTDSYEYAVRRDALNRSLQSA